MVHLELLKGGSPARAGHGDGDQTAVPEGHGYSSVALVKELEDSNGALSYRYGLELVNVSHRDPRHAELHCEVSDAAAIYADGGLEIMPARRRLLDQSDEGGLRAIR